LDDELGVTDELTATEEELTALDDELTATDEELTAVDDELTGLDDELTATEELTTEELTTTPPVELDATELGLELLMEELAIEELTGTELGAAELSDDELITEELTTAELIVVTELELGVGELLAGADEFDGVGFFDEPPPPQADNAVARTKSIRGDKVFFIGRPCNVYCWCVLSTNDARAGYRILFGKVSELLRKACKTRPII
jgi:hypothetical protein